MLFTPFTFQNGKTAKNRIFKSAWKSNLPKTTSRLKNSSACTALGCKAARAFWLRVM